MSADISPVGEKGADGGEDKPKITTGEIAPHCSWWVVSARCNSGQQKHIPDAVRESNDGIPDDPDIDPPSRPLCATDRDVPWLVKSYTVIPPGWVDDEKVCDNCADEFLALDLELEGVSEDAE